MEYFEAAKRERKSSEIKKLQKRQDYRSITGICVARCVELGRAEVSEEEGECLLKCQQKLFLGALPLYKDALLGS